MLTELNIRNFAIIDELKVAFDGGLNIISGETGAGKSIIIGAVGLILGDRANIDMIRSHEDAAVVEALFDIRDQDAVKEKIHEMGFGDGDELVVRVDNVKRNIILPHALAAREVTEARFEGDVLHVYFAEHAP